MQACLEFIWSNLGVLASSSFTSPQRMYVTFSFQETWNELSRTHTSSTSLNILPKLCQTQCIEGNISLIIEFMASHGQTSGFDANRNIGCSQASQRPWDGCVWMSLLPGLSLQKDQIEMVWGRQAQGSVPHAVVLTDRIRISREATFKRTFPRPRPWWNELAFLGGICTVTKHRAVSGLLCWRTNIKHLPIIQSQSCWVSFGSGVTHTAPSFIPLPAQSRK